MFCPFALLPVLPPSPSMSSALSPDTALSDCLTPDASVRSPDPAGPEPEPVAVMASGFSLSAGL